MCSTKTATSLPDRSLALVGAIGESQRGYLLKSGLNRVGRSPANEIVLDEPGVSQHHAALLCQSSVLEIRDLASKNGTYVNGVRISEKKLKPGDELRFGSLALRIEEVDPEDTWLGVHASAAGSEETTPATADATSTVVWNRSVGSLEARRWLQLLDDVAQELVTPAANRLTRALGPLRRAYGASGVALLELVPGDPVVRASHGRLHAELPHQQLKDCVREAGRSATALVRAVPGKKEGTPSWTIAVAAGSPVGIALQGAEISEAAGTLALRTIARLFELSLRRRAKRDIKPEIAAELSYPQRYVQGESAVMTEVYQQLAAISQTNLPLLILGETGVGKELVARTVHLSSDRRDRPFLPINCAAIPTDLLEAELFGIGRGVATGVEQRKGKFALAHGGTLFLDEIGEMPVALQGKLLRALEESVIRPLGAEPVKIDVRIVAATNSDLEEKTDRGQFRPDLYYRLAGMVVTVPPLRKRREDIPALVEHFFRGACEESGRRVTGITYGGLRRLTGRSWPGNVRELEHAVRQLVYLAPVGSAIDSKLVAGIGEHTAELGVRGEAPSPAGDFTRWENLDLHLAEKTLLEEALQRVAGNQSEAAKLLGVSRSSLRRRLRKHGLHD